LPGAIVSNGDGVQKEGTGGGAAAQRRPDARALAPTGVGESAAAGCSGNARLIVRVVSSVKCKWMWKWMSPVTATGCGRPHLAASSAVL